MPFRLGPPDVRVWVVWATVYHGDDRDGDGFECLQCGKQLGSDYNAARYVGLCPVHTAGCKFVKTFDHREVELIRNLTASSIGTGSSLVLNGP